MTNSIWQATIQNDAGDIVPGAEITVVDEGTGLNATIYSSRGGAALANPFFADANGFAQFYAAAGTYRVTAENTGTGETQTWRYIDLGDAASRDVGTSAGQLMEVGAGGLLGNTIRWTTNDLNDINKTGFYDIDGSDSNVPSGGGHLTHAENSTENNGAQSYIDIVEGRSYFRVKANSSFQGWNEFYHSSNLNHLQNTSGGSIASNATTAGSNLTPAQTGTWLNASGASIANNGYGLWIKQ